MTKKKPEAEPKPTPNERPKRDPLDPPPGFVRTLTHDHATRTVNVELVPIGVCSTCGTAVALGATCPVDGTVAK